MKKKIRTFVITIIFLIFLVITFIPFVDSTDDFHYYCRYRFAVYECWICDSEGEGCYSDFFFFNVELGEKIGGPLEYFELKEIKNDTIKK
jgi:hypothetical protein